MSEHTSFIDGGDEIRANRYAGPIIVLTVRHSGRPTDDVVCLTADAAADLRLLLEQALEGLS